MKYYMIERMCELFKSHLHRVTFRKTRKGQSVHVSVWYQITFSVRGTRARIVCSFSLNLEWRPRSTSLWMCAAAWFWAGFDLIIADCVACRLAQEVRFGFGFHLAASSSCSRSSSCFCRRASCWRTGTIFSVHRRNNDCRGAQRRGLLWSPTPRICSGLE